MLLRSAVSHIHARACSSGGLKATTILSVRKGNKVVMIGDGQVSYGSNVLKGNARKVRIIGHPGSSHPVIAGFAGSTADALTFFERLEEKLEKYPGQLLRSSVELARDWRRDKVLRKLDALMLVADPKVQLMLTGTGDVIEPESPNPSRDGGVLAIGSGSLIARAAATALMDIEGLDAEDIARRSMTIAADMCVYTNHNVTIETLDVEKSS